VRVVAGSAGGLRLSAPPGYDVRPTTDKVRAAIFSSLDATGDLAGARVLDLFAGTGSLGIEALSRGAESATFVDNSREAIAAINANLATTRLAAHATVERADALRFLAGGERFDLALVDPPYAFAGWEGLLAHAFADLVVLESDRALTLGEAWQALRTKRYGGTVVTMARAVG
jgi:16S rRNA (guanine966-N2)-methyltransferase